MPSPKTTVFDVRAMKERGEKITVLTAYDAGFAGMIDAAGIDVILVGDSVGMVVMGLDSTVPVTMDAMIHHCQAVRRGVAGALLVGDMPFMSYQVSIEDTLVNGGRFLKEAGCDAVKLEGGAAVCDKITALTKAGIPVMGHIGLTPQTAGQLGGFKVQGKDIESARRMIHDAKAVEAAGAFSLVLECIPDALAGYISQELSIPTIGIGAGAGCDGQVLVTHDLLGLYEKFLPKFVKQYANLAPQIKGALESYRNEVKNGSFPDEKHSFAMQLNLDDIIKE